MVDDLRELDAETGMGHVKTFAARWHEHRSGTADSGASVLKGSYTATVRHIESAIETVAGPPLTC